MVPLGACMRNGLTSFALKSKEMQESRRMQSRMEDVQNKRPTEKEEEADLNSSFECD